LDEVEKKYRAAPDNGTAFLGILQKVIGEPVFLDDEKAISIRLDQPKATKPLHKPADPRPRRADHLRQFFMGNLQLDRMLRGSFLPMVRANCNNVWPSRFLDESGSPFYPEARTFNERKLIIFSAFHRTSLVAASGSSSELLSVRLAGRPVWTFSLCQKLHRRASRASCCREYIPVIMSLTI
jgi:hypothetical protein